MFGAVTIAYDANGKWLLTSSRRVNEADPFGGEMTKVFINYRRDDSQRESVKIYNRLAEAFGHDNLFLDVAGIPKGDDFVEVLKEALGRCNVLLSLIGPQWLTLKDSDGNRRIDNAGDLVRLEIREALKRDIRIIPALLEGTRMPTSADLPSDLEALARRNAISISTGTFDADMTTLFDTLSKEMGVRPRLDALRLTLVTDRHESWKAFKLLHETVATHGERVTCILGYPGGQLKASVYHVKNADFWCYPTENKDYHKFYIPFGRGTPSIGINNMALQINPPHEGENKRLAGVFLTDHRGRYYIGHTGRLGGGRKGIGKAEFKEYYGPNGWLAFERTDGTDEAIVFGPLGTDMPLEQLSKFIRIASDFREFAVDEGDG
jgi:TIR domain